MMNKEKLDKYTTDYEDIIDEELLDAVFQKTYLDESLKEYLEDGNFDLFFKSLERVIKARGSVSDFARKTELDRSNLYAMFNGEQIPRFDTVMKILKELGFTLKVA